MDRKHTLLSLKPDSFLDVGLSDMDACVLDVDRNGRVPLARVHRFFEVAGTMVFAEIVRFRYIALKHSRIQCDVVLLQQETAPREVVPLLSITSAWTLHHDCRSSNGACRALARRVGGHDAPVANGGRWRSIEHHGSQYMVNNFLPAVH